MLIVCVHLYITSICAMHCSLPCSILSSPSDEGQVKVAHSATNSLSSSTYTISLVGGSTKDFTDTHIHLYSPLTEQKVHIPISYHSDSKGEVCPPEVKGQPNSLPKPEVPPTKSHEPKREEETSLLEHSHTDCGVGGSYWSGTRCCLHPQWQSSGSQQTGFQSFIPESSPQPLFPIHSVLKGGSPTPSLDQCGDDDTPMVSMATPFSTGGGFMGLSPQTSLRRTIPTSVMSLSIPPARPTDPCTVSPNYHLI